MAGFRLLNCGICSGENEGHRGTLVIYYTEGSHICVHSSKIQRQTYRWNYMMYKMFIKLEFLPI